MLLTFIGAMLILFSLIETVNWVTLVIGFILTGFGVLSMDVHTDNVNAWYNRQQYWAKGKKPDWAAENKKGRYCSLCGKLTTSGDKYCPHCGTKL